MERQTKVCRTLLLRQIQTLDHFLEPRIFADWIPISFSVHAKQFPIMCLEGFAKLLKGLVPITQGRIDARDSITSHVLRFSYFPVSADHFLCLVPPSALRVSNSGVPQCKLVCRISL